MLEKLIIGGGILAVVAVLVVLLVVGPFLSITAVNLLFGTSIPLTFWTWLSTFWLHIVVSSSYKASRG